MSPQSWSWFYFSLAGRINRRQYWRRWMLPIGIPASILLAVIEAVTGYQSGRIENERGCLGAGLSFLVLTPIAWPSLAVSVKRFHDRDKPGWWVLIALIPVIGVLWILVENGFLQGTVGSNRFGPEPHET